MSSGPHGPIFFYLEWASEELYIVSMSIFRGESTLNRLPSVQWWRCEYTEQASFCPVLLSHITNSPLNHWCTMTTRGLHILQVTLKLSSELIRGTSTDGTCPSVHVNALRHGRLTLLITSQICTVFTVNALTKDICSSVRSASLFFQEIQIKYLSICGCVFCTWG